MLLPKFCKNSAAVRVLEDTKGFSDLLSLWVYDSGSRGGGCIKHFLIAENEENALIEKRSRQGHIDLHVEGSGPAENVLMLADSLAIFTDHGSILQIRK